MTLRGRKERAVTPISSANALKDGQRE